MKTIRCAIIDDEELARTLILAYIEKLDHLEVVIATENPLEAISLLKENAVDLLFLDIQMPQIKGTDFAKLIPASVQVIFTTAYSEYALEGFELNALDYLLKPITFERFLQAVNKYTPATTQNTTTPELDYITVKSGYDLHRLNFNDILYIQSDSEYVIYYLKDAKIMSNQSLKKLESLLPSASFMRVHRSYIINKTKVTAMKNKELVINETPIPVSANYFETVKSELF